MANNNEKAPLRKMLLEKRDSTSFDLMKIASKQIHKNLKKIDAYSSAQSIGFYYPIGSEVLTQDMMQEAISKGKTIGLPKVVDDEIIFKKIKDFHSIEKGSFDIMEPKDSCPTFDELDVILVPTVGVSRKGVRLGYGYGYYDRFLAKTNSTSIALTYAKQVVKSIPQSKSDVIVDWIVTEDEYFKTLEG